MISETHKYLYSGHTQYELEIANMKTHFEKAFSKSVPGTKIGVRISENRAFRSCVVREGNGSATIYVGLASPNITHQHRDKLMIAKFFQSEIHLEQSLVCSF